MNKHQLRSALELLTHQIHHLQNEIQIIVTVDDAKERAKEALEQHLVKLRIIREKLNGVMDELKWED